MRGCHSGTIGFLLVALLAGGCASLPSLPPTAATFSAAERVEHNGRVFDRAWQLVNDRFFDAKFRGVDWSQMKARYRPAAEKAPDDDALYAVVNSLLAELKESHNYAMTPQRRWEMIAKQRARVGLAFRQLEEHWIVTEVVPGSPAEEAGVRPGWLVTGRDGRPLESLATFAIKEGQTVVYEFLTEKNETRTQPLTARVISTGERQEVHRLANGAMYLRFDGFDRQSLHWLSDQLKANRAAPAVVIDLRYNHGGLFYSLEFSLGEFFPKSVQLGTFVRRSGTETEKDSYQFFSARYPGKVVVLTDRTTASCAEILTHALRYHERAIVVGRPTAGAVVASRFFSLPDGGMLQLAVEDFRGLDGQRLEGAGVKPDVPVALKLADLRAGVDSDLAAAEASLQLPEILAKN